jgi:hypothetical protein
MAQTIVAVALRRCSGMGRLMAMSKNDRDGVADLQTQLESLLDAVWNGERMWKLEDRMNLQIEADRSPEPRTRRRRE